MSEWVQKWSKDGYLVSTDQRLLQLKRVHSFLSLESYWSKDIPLAVVENAARGSLCFGLYDQATKTQIGFARVVTDYATFAWICDVYVESAHRGKSLSKWLMQCMMEHLKTLSPPYGLRRICLATKDAHGLYEKYGFQVTATPQNWLEIKDNDLYLKASAETKA